MHRRHADHALSARPCTECSRRNAVPKANATKPRGAAKAPATCARRREEATMEATITLGQDYPLPEEEQIAGTYQLLLRRLSHQSVVKHFDAYADVDWEAAEYRIDPEDPRWELDADDVLGATAWYRSQPQPIRARIGLHLIATKMKIGLQFEN